MANQVETPDPPQPSTERPPWVHWLAGVASVLALVCLAWVLVRRINNVPWARPDMVLAVATVVLFLAALVVYWRELTGAATSRGTLLQLNAGVATLLFFGIVVLVNRGIIDRHFGWVKADWTKEKFYSLSEQTLNVLKHLTKDDAVELVALIPSDEFTDPRVRELQRKRLEEYHRASEFLTLKVLDPYLSSEAVKICREAGITTIPAVLIRLKDKPEVNEKVTSLEEAELTRGILKVLDTTSRKVYFLTGHGEAKLDDSGRDGLSSLKEQLTNNRYDSAELDLGKQSAVPDDAACLVAVWPKYAYRDDELQKISAYLSPERGGRLFAFLDPDANTNLQDVLKDHGIVWHPEVVSDPVNSQGDAKMYASIDFADHETVKYHKMLRVPVAFVRSSYLTTESGPDLEVSDLIKTTASAFAQAEQPQAKPAEGQAAPPPPAKVNGPLTIAMVSTTKEKEEDKDEADTKDKPKDQPAEADNEKRVRVAVVADGDFATNFWSRYSLANLEIAANLVAWLTDNSKAIGIPPKDPYKDLENRKIALDQKGKRWVFLLTLVLPLILVVAAGVAVQIVRR